MNESREEGARPILTVGQLTHAIKSSLEGTFPHVVVQGEVSNCKRQSSGHFYFSLKDCEAQISCVLFRGNASRASAHPKDGDKVVAHGALNVYPPSGKYQLVVRELQLTGVGELLLRLEQLKQEIHRRGWFRKEHKKAIPKFPKKIGVVTSPTGAAIQDILNVLTRRFSGFHLILNPVRVQGAEAPQEIAQAIRQFNETKLVDVMIIGRGGGSIEDLWAFNEEVVAEAVFHSEIPIIAAVGHEIDHCIAEYVADVRAPTPSAAAEIVIAEKELQSERLSQLRKRLDHNLSLRLKHERQKVAGLLRHPLFSSPYYLLGGWMQRMDDYRTKFEQTMVALLRQQRMSLEGRERLLRSLSPLLRIARYKERLSQLTVALDRAVAVQLEKAKRELNREQRQSQLDSAIFSLMLLRKEHLSKVVMTLSAIDPKHLLKKGYSIVFSQKSGSVINSVRQVEAGEKIRLMLSDGELLSVVESVQEPVSLSESSS